MTSSLMLRRRLGRLLAAGLLLAPVACESNSSPTAPSGSLQVTLGAGVLKAGDTTTAQAAAAGAPAGGVVWSSSNQTVATVDAAGTVLARRAGTATLTATTTSATGQASLRVVSDYGGTWSGPIVRSQPSCSPTSTAPVCGASPTPGTLHAPITLTLEQTGNVVTGTLVDALEPGLSIIVSGEVSDGDVLTLSGSTIESLALTTRQLTVSSFRATFDPTVGTITGSYNVTAVAAGPTGAAVPDYNYQAQVRDLPRR